MSVWDLLWHKWDYIVYSCMSFFFFLLFLSLSPYTGNLFLFIFFHFSQFSIFILSERIFHLWEWKFLTLLLLLLFLALFFPFCMKYFLRRFGSAKNEAFLIAIFHFILPHSQFETRVKLVWGKFSLILCSCCCFLTILLWGWKWASLRDVKKNVFFCEGWKIFQNKP